MKIIKYITITCVAFAAGSMAYYFQPQSLQIEALVVPAYVDARLIESTGITIETLKSSSFITSAAKRSAVPIEFLLDREGNSTYKIDVKPNRGGDAIFIKMSTNYLGSKDLKLLESAHNAVIHELILQQNETANALLAATGAVTLGKGKSELYELFIDNTNIRSPVRHLLERSHLAYAPSVTFRKPLPSISISVILFWFIFFGIEAIVFTYRKQWQ